MRAVPVLAGGMLSTLAVLGCESREATAPVATPHATSTLDAPADLPNHVAPSPSPLPRQTVGAQLPPPAALTRLAPGTPPGDQVASDLGPTRRALEAAARQWTMLDHPAAEKDTDLPEFEPPFAGRQDIFTPPTVGAEGPRTPSPTSAGSEATVELKGFVFVGEPRVVLLIGEEIAPLAVGQERQGVKVLAIEPPQVTLQQGRTRWNLSLAPPAAE